MRPDLPAAPARDAVEHTWLSYPVRTERLLLSDEFVARLAGAVRPEHPVVARDAAA